MQHLQTGTILSRYRILKVLGAGGIGVTYLANDEALDKLFAIREYFPSEFADRYGEAIKPKAARIEDFAWAKRRFIEEARVLARFNHPNILSVIQIIEANDTAYIVFDYAGGRSFHEWLREIGDAPTQHELDLIVEPVLDALMLIHKSGVLSLQIDPTNIFIRDDGSPVILDLDVPNARNKPLQAIVQAHYSPVELYSTKGIGRGPWTDIYAFSATLYYAMTGTAPPESTERLLADAYVPVARAMSDGLRNGGRHFNYRQSFLGAIDWGLKLAPKDRPQSLAEWRTALFKDEKKKVEPRNPLRVEVKVPHLPLGKKLRQYKILDVLGAGGFGITYRAKDESLNKIFAIKEYFPEDFAQRKGMTVRAKTGRDKDFAWGKGRFIDEARILAKFEHPNIVNVIQIFEANNAAYLVLGYQGGRNFKEWLDEIGDPPVQLELDSVVVPILNALDVIHRNNVLHRDIAPNNIYIRDDGSPVLLDFGSAREEIAQRTKTVSALVKSGYSPIEQYSGSGSGQGPWSDIYALAATLYHAVTGGAPVEATERMLTDDHVKTGVATKIRFACLGRVADYRPSFLEAIDWGLKPAPKDRPQTVAEWRAALFAKA